VAVVGNDGEKRAGWLIILPFPFRKARLNANAAAAVPDQELADRAGHTSTAEFSEREEARRTGKERLLVRSAMSNAGVRMLGRPVFGRKRHTPESRARNGKFQADFSFATTHRTEKHHMTFLFSSVLTFST
jgi:hypothetical protein